MKYYLFKHEYHAGLPDRFSSTREVYWTGNFDLNTNDPLTVDNTKRAAGFSTARSAYECGGLNKMYRWQVGKR